MKFCLSSFCNSALIMNSRYHRHDSQVSHFFVFFQPVLPVIIKPTEFFLSLPFKTLNFQTNESRISIHYFYSNHDIRYFLSGNHP